MAAYGAPTSSTIFLQCCMWWSYFKHHMQSTSKEVIGERERERDREIDICMEKGLLQEVLPYVDLLDECASHFVQIHHNIKCQMLINFPIH